MANNDQAFNGVGFAIGKQSAFGAVNTTIRDLGAGPHAVSTGIVLGDKDSGDAESGITLPNMSAIYREVSQVASSFTQSADFFLREAIEGLAITFPLKGNGRDAGAPTVGLAAPDVGIIDIYGCAGLVGANGAAAPDYKFTPRATTEYATIHLWVADMDFVFRDCVCDVMKIAFPPGGAPLVTANFKVGAVNNFGEPITFPTFTWAQQASFAPKVVAGVAFSAFGQTRGFENLEITITNTIAEYGDSNVATTGLRQAQTERIITVDGRIYAETADSDAEHTALVNPVAPTADLSFQIGVADVGGAETELEGVLINVNNLQATEIKYDRTGSALAVELSGAKATALTAGDEFMIEYN